MKYVTCLYDLEGKLIGTRKWSCLGCAKKRMAKTTPACVREATQDGTVVYENKYFKKIKRKIE